MLLPLIQKFIHHALVILRPIWLEVLPPPGLEPHPKPCLLFLPLTVFQPLPLHLNAQVGAQHVEVALALEQDVWVQHAADPRASEHPRVDQCDFGVGLRDELVA